MKKNKWIKIMAFLALFWIIIWIVWTWLLIILEKTNNSDNIEQEITPEQLKQLQEMFNSWSTLDVNTTEEIKTWIWKQN